MKQYVHLDRGLHLPKGSVLPTYFCRSPLDYMAKMSMLLISCSDLSHTYWNFTSEILLGLWVGLCALLNSQKCCEGQDESYSAMLGGMNPGDSNTYCVLQIPGYLMRVQETSSLVACFVVQTWNSVVERTPKGRFSQLLPAACCTLLRVMFWTPENQGGSVLSAVWLGFFYECLPLSGSASPSAGNKGTKCLK